MSLLLTSRPTIVDRLIPRSLVADFALVVSGTALTAAAAQIAIPTQLVPITGQTFAVLLVSSALGKNRAVLSMGLYVLLGALGLPIFTGAKSGWAFGPTLGYLVGFILAAAVVGSLAERGWDKKFYGVIASFVLGNLTIYAVGLPMLSVFLGSVDLPNDLMSTLSAGFLPFIFGDGVKIALAAAVLPLAWAGVKKIKG